MTTINLSSTWTGLPASKAGCVVTFSVTRNGTALGVTTATVGSSGNITATFSDNSPVVGQNSYTITPSSADCLGECVLPPANIIKYHAVQTWSANPICVGDAVTWNVSGGEPSGSVALRRQTWNGASWVSDTSSTGLVLVNFNAMGSFSVATGAATMAGLQQYVMEGSYSTVICPAQLQTNVCSNSPPPPPPPPPAPASCINTTQPSPVNPALVCGTTSLDVSYSGQSYGQFNNVASMNVVNVPAGVTATFAAGYITFSGSGVGPYQLQLLPSDGTCPTCQIAGNVNIASSACNYVVSTEYVGPAANPNGSKPYAGGIKLKIASAAGALSSISANANYPISVTNDTDISIITNSFGGSASATLAGASASLSGGFLAPNSNGELFIAIDIDAATNATIVFNGNVTCNGVATPFSVPVTVTTP